MTTIIIGAGPAGLQYAYYLQKYKIDYIVIEQNSVCGSYYQKKPYSRELLFVNYNDRSLKNDMYSLLCDDYEDFNFYNYSVDYYPKSDDYLKYLNDFYKKYNLNIHFNTTVLKIRNVKNQYDILTNKKIYKCIKIIIATGYSKKNIPDVAFLLSDKQEIKHYDDYDANYFINTENLEKFKDKKILLIGCNNLSFELMNILDKYAQNIMILGKNKNLSLLSYINSKYLNILNSCYVNYKNSIVFYNIDNCTIFENTDDTNINYQQFYIEKDYKIIDFNTVSFFDFIILCTGYKFDTTIFDKSLQITFDNDYPEIDFRFNSNINCHISFIGSLMEKNNKCPIHKYRYIIKNLVMTEYFIDLNNNYRLVFNNNIHDFYNQLTKYIYNRINNSYDLLHTNGLIVDLFYFDVNNLSFNYFENFLYRDKIYEFSNINEIFIIKIVKSYDENILVFPKVEIDIFKRHFDYLSFYDKITFKDHAFANFNSKILSEQIFSSLKYIKLIF